MATSASPGHHATPAQRMAPYGVIAAAWLWFWWPSLAGDLLLYIRDVALFAVPNKSHLIARFAQGEVPLWSAHIAGGMPFMADPTNQVFYPLNAVLLLGDSVAHGVTLLTLAHSLLAMFAAYHLARVLEAGRAAATWAALLFGFSGYAVSITDHTVYIAVMVWAPWTLAAFLTGLVRSSHRYSAAAALAFSMLVLAGDGLDSAILAATVVFLGALASAGVWLPAGARPDRAFAARHTALTLGLAALVSAIQVLPTLDLLAVSHRDGGLGAAAAGQWSFPPPRTLEIVAPFLFGAKYPARGFLATGFYPDLGTPWASSVYLGLIPVAAAAFGALRRAVWPFVLLLGAALVLAYGRHTPVLAALLELVPSLGTQRFPEKLIVWLTLWLSLLAALGAPGIASATVRLAAGLRARGWTLRLTITLFLAAALFGGLLWVPVAHWMDAADQPSLFWTGRFGRPATHLQGVLAHAAIVFALLAAGAWIPPGAARAWVRLLAVFAVVDLLWLHHGYAPTAPAALLSTRPAPSALAIAATDATEPLRKLYYDEAPIPVTEGMVDDRIARRIMAAYGVAGPPHGEGFALLYWRLLWREFLRPNIALEYGVRYENYFFSALQPRRQVEIERSLGPRAPWIRMALYGVTHVVTPIAPGNPRFGGPGFREAGRDEALNLRVLRVVAPAPEAWLVTDLESAEVPADRLTRIANLGAGYRTRAILSAPHPHAGARTAAAPSGSVTWSRPRPEQWLIDVDADAAHRLLVVNESRLPGWVARVDGRTVEIVEVNHRQIGIPINAGHQRVTLRYEPSSFGYGVGTSAIGLFLVALIGVVSVPRR